MKSLGGRLLKYQGARWGVKAKTGGEKEKLRTRRNPEGYCAGPQGWKKRSVAGRKKGKVDLGGFAGEERVMSGQTVTEKKRVKNFTIKEPSKGKLN